MTHDELVRRVGRWLRSTKRHAVVLEEIGTDGFEFPDVIGWYRHAATTLVECKISVSDFDKDAKKPFRKRPEMGMGDERWYACPEGLLAPEDMPPGWGLLWVGPKTCKVKKQPSYRFPATELIKRKEARLLVSALVRATEGWGRKVFGEISPVDGQLDPHPTVASTLKAYQKDYQTQRERLHEAQDLVRARDREIERLNAKLREWERYDASVKAGKPVDDMPFG